MKIVLIGYMASGKSAIGKVLSTKLNTDFIDLDAYIESQEKMLISTIFSQKGEIYFRKKEGFYLKQLLNTEKNQVISVGGGTPCYGNNMNEINKYATSIYLKTSIKTIYNRLLTEKDKRPLVANIKNENLQEFIAKHLFERIPYYEKANFTLDSNEKKVEKLVSEIQQLI